MHHLFSLLQALLLLTLVLRLLVIGRRYLRNIAYSPKGTRRECFQHHPCVHPFWVSYGILSDPLFTPDEKRMMVMLEFMMAFVRIVLLFPLQVLGVPDSWLAWVTGHTYAELRGRFGEIEFSERVLCILCQDDEGDEEGFSTNEL
jgi:hypothetical protein